MPGPEAQGDDRSLLPFCFRLAPVVGRILARGDFLVCYRKAWWRRRAGGAHVHERRPNSCEPTATLREPAGVVMAQWFHSGGRQNAGGQ